MARVIYGQDRYLILEKANQFFESFSKQFPGAEKWVYQTSDQAFDLGQVKEAVETISLFGTPKWVFLFVENDKDMTKIDEKAMINWFTLSNNEVMFVLVLPKKLPTKSELRKAIAKYADETTITVSGKDSISVSERTRREIKGHNLRLEPGAFEEIVKRFGTNSSRIAQEIEKLSLLEHSITVKDVEQLISYDIQNDIFALSNSLLQKDQTEVFRIYHQLLNQKNDPLSLAPLIASSLRGMYQVETLQSLNYSASDIREILKMSEGQFWNITRRNVRPKDAILEILNKLSAFDQESKLGLKDRFVSFEMLLLSIMM